LPFYAAYADFHAVVCCAPPRLHSIDAMPFFAVYAAADAIFATLPLSPRFRYFSLDFPCLLAGASAGASAIIFERRHAIDAAIFLRLFSPAIFVSPPFRAALHFMPRRRHYIFFIFIRHCRHALRHAAHARHATRCPPQALRAAFSIVAATLFRLRRRRFRHHFRRHADYAFFIAATLAFFAASLLRRLLIRRHSFSRRRHYFV
jgi:hypothetical protein